MNPTQLKIFERVDYTGEFLIMRDAAQKRIETLLRKNQNLPFSLSNQIVFYAGPTKSSNNRVAIGPTTSERMDRYLKMLFELGVIATVGKGKRTEIARELCRQYRRLYFVAPSGAAAALSEHVRNLEIVAFEDLGPEAVYRIQVENFPLIVATDCDGNDIFSVGSYRF
ncbi:FumA C-terminus/TtdB family hydratase beta subunit [Pseudothermotoga sp. U03pept]|uniref:FumA C-terminus/TtdB family hydratase beta subunit n=1 Tax=Pseudothermotoga sp. U03pept TaxID=3447012 RepID=UPI003F0E21A2